MELASSSHLEAKPNNLFLRRSVKHRGPPKLIQKRKNTAHSTIESHLLMGNDGHRSQDDIRVVDDDLDMHPEDHIGSDATIFNKH